MVNQCKRGVMTSSFPYLHNMMERNNKWWQWQWQQWEEVRLVWQCPWWFRLSESLAGLEKVRYFTVQTWIHRFRAITHYGIFTSLYSLILSMFDIQGLKCFLLFTQISQLTKLWKHENTKLWPKMAKCEIALGAVKLS
jgi:hypothetical protein